MKKEKLEVFSSGKIIFKGFIKNGLDSSTMVSLIVCFDSEFNEFKNRGFTFPPNLFYYHEISRNEVIGVLINEYKFEKEEAKISFDKLIKEFNLEKISRNEETDKLYESIVEDTNKRLLIKEKNEKLKIGENDIIIIAGFLRNKITFIHSGDNGFTKTCEELGLNIFPTPKRDVDKENEIKKWIKKS